MMCIVNTYEDTTLSDKPELSFTTDGPPPAPEHTGTDFLVAFYRCGPLPLFKFYRTGVQLWR